MRIIWVILFSLLVTATVSARVSSPLHVSANSGYLVDTTNTPVFLSGEAGWSLVSQLTMDSISYYLTDRHNRRYNAVMVNLIEAAFATNAPNNISGVAPFDSLWVGLREAYWRRVDSTIAKADTLGIYIVAFPMYFGSTFNQGWGQQVYDATTAQMTKYGRLLGKRYRNYPNIIWAIGGDYGENPWAAALVTNTNAFVAGLKDSDNVYTSRVYTKHTARGRVMTHVDNQSWLSLDATYDELTGSTGGGPPYYGSQVIIADSAYTDAIHKPFIHFEGSYEGEQGDANYQRQLMWQTPLRGCIGFFNGNCPLWHFNSNGIFCAQSSWVPQLNSQASNDQKRMDSLLTSKAWYNLVPDRSNLVISAGAQGPATSTLATFAYDSLNGTCIIGYMPTARAMTMSVSKINQSYANIHYFFYNPSTGVKSFDTVKAMPTAPASVSISPSPAGDWVFVMEGQNIVPSVPVPSSPIGGATVTTTPKIIAWHPSTGSPTAYKIQLTGVNDFTYVTPVQVTDTTYYADLGTVSQKYYWRVKSKNATDSSAYSAVDSFLYSSIPQQPYTVSPADNALNVAMSPLFVWNSSLTAASYTLQITTTSGNYGSPFYNTSGLTDTTKTVALSSGTAYWWRVSATNGTGTSAYSSEKKLTTTTDVSVHFGQAKFGRINK